jgi:hypothetical protein
MCADGAPGSARRRGAQRGSLLIEFMVAAALALALVVWGTHEWAERVRVLQARSLAAWMESARDAVQAYLDRESGRILERMEEAAGSGDPDGLLPGPDWEALRALGMLPAGWEPVGPLGQSLGIALERDGDCARGTCAVRALVHTRAPLLGARGTLDEALVAEWLMAAHGRGFVLWPHRPDAFSGAGQRIPVSGGPAGAWVPGMVALLAARSTAGPSTGTDPAESGGTEDFLRVRDPRDPDFQNDLTAQGIVRSGSQLVARDSVVLEQGWKSGTACSTEGAVGRDQAYPGVLICREGRWRLIARAEGGGYLLNSRRGCQNSLAASTHNPYTGGCFCPPGFTLLQVSESGSVSTAEGLTSGFLCIPN